MVGECSGRYGRAKLMPGTWRIGVRSAEGASGGRRARSCTEGSGGKSWNARRKGRLRLRPWLGSLQGRQSASYPVTPLSGCRDEAVLSSLVTRSAGLRLKRDRNCVRTARGTASLSLSLFLSFSLSLCLCVSFSVSTSLCMVSRDQCQGQCHGYHGATVCWVAGFRPSPGHPSHHVRRVGQWAPSSRWPGQLFVACLLSGGKDRLTRLTITVAIGGTRFATFFTVIRIK